MKFKKRINFRTLCLTIIFSTFNLDFFVNQIKHYEKKKIIVLNWAPLFRTTFCNYRNAKYFTCELNLPPMFYQKKSVRFINLPVLGNGFCQWKHQINKVVKQLNKQVDESVQCRVRNMNHSFVVNSLFEILMGFLAQNVYVECKSLKWLTETNF